MTQNRQLALDLNAYNESSNYLDDNRHGYFALCQKTPKFHQKFYPLNELANVVTASKYCEVDTWISQAVFNGQYRRKVGLNSIALLFVDIDYYNVPELRHKSPEHVLSLVNQTCIAKALPMPSTVLFSGKGLQLKWFHEPLPRRALPRWEIAEKHLVETFSSLGADMAVRDATRILRLVDTYNTKTGKAVTVLDYTGKHYAFNELCESLLPYSQEQIKEWREKSKTKAKQGGKARVTSINSVTGLSLRSLNWNRLCDLQQLQRLRGGDMGEGQRKLMAFWQANFYALNYQGNYADPNTYYELQRICAEAYPNMPSNEVKRNASQLHRLMKESAQGRRIEFNGKEYLPLYTPKNDYLINLFGITSEEMTHMKTVIDGNESQRRNTEYQRNKRREQGVVSRDEYERRVVADKIVKAIKAKQLKEQGLSQRKIAQELGVSKTSVQKYLCDN